MDKKTMDYLRTIMTLEKEKFTQEKLIDELESEVYSLGRSEYISKPLRERTVISDCIHWGVLAGFVGMIVAFIVFIIQQINAVYAGGLWDFVWNHFSRLFLCAVFAILAGIAVTIIVAVLIGIFGKKARKKKYNKDLKEYGDEVEADNQRVAIENKKKEILVKEIESLKVSLSETKSALTKLYEIGIIYKKYWDIIPITRFYEYFESGRSNSFKGREGVYDIYEGEIRLDKIVGKLDIVIEKLDNIRDAQFELYRVISEGNKKTEELLDSVVQSVNRLENSSQITAYNTMVSAQNTEAIKNMMFYQQLLKTHK